MMKYILRFGLIAGIILMLEIIITFSLMKRSGNMQGSEVFGYSIMALVLGICMVLAMLRFRKEGPAKIGKGIMLCLGLGVLASFLYVIGWAITYHFIVPDFM